MEGNCTEIAEYLKLLRLLGRLGRVNILASYEDWGMRIVPTNVLESLIQVTFVRRIQLYYQPW